jgi:hypothetical protein
MTVESALNPKRGKSLQIRPLSELRARRELKEPVMSPEFQSSC